MADKREQILARLETVLTALPGYKVVTRNAQNLPEQVRPAIVILDSDEEVLQHSASPSARAITMVKMTPQIFVLDDGRSTEIGTTMNAHRAAVIKAVATDTELRTLCGTNGSVQYESCITGLASGRSLEGEMGVYFSFVYHLDPTQL